MAATAHQLQQADLFRSRLPRRPYATDYMEWGVRPMPQAVAVQKRHIQPNPPRLTYWLVLDVDRPDAAIRWEELGLPAPTWIARNPENGHAHLAYGLAAPVAKSDAAREAPLKLAAAIQAAYTDALGADVNYSGLICKNPLHPDWQVLWFCRGEHDLYSLGDLADYVDLRGFGGKRRKVPEVGLGRNLALFDRLRAWAYKAVRDYWRPGGYDDWKAAVMSKAGRYNTFAEPLPGSEIRGIARSVSKWVWQRFTPAEFRAIQGQRGRRKGAKRRADLIPRAQEMRAQGLTQAAIAKELEVNQSTLSRWLRTPSEALCKAISDNSPLQGGMRANTPVGGHHV